MFTVTSIHALCIKYPNILTIYNVSTQKKYSNWLTPTRINLLIPVRWGWCLSVKYVKH